MAGGMGDAAAAWKLIKGMQQMLPITVKMMWALPPSACLYEKNPSYFPPRSLLQGLDPSRTYIIPHHAVSPKNIPDLLILGPLYCSKRCVHETAQRIMENMGNKVVLQFAENAFPQDPSDETTSVRHLNDISAMNLSYGPVLHSALFPHHYGNGNQVPLVLHMGLEAGSGILLDPNRPAAGSSPEDHLLKIGEPDLRKNILAAMDVPNGERPNYNRYSFYFGYAHWPSSWTQFIELAALNEREKDVVVVLNRKLSIYPTMDAFQEDIFTDERLAFLKEKGYRTVVLKGPTTSSDKNPTIVLPLDEKQPAGRSLTVIVRDSFSPEDVKSMQLAANGGLLATGDNTAAESFESLATGPKVYAYETFHYKYRFLEQQKKIANKWPPVDSLLALFATPLPSMDVVFDRNKLDKLEAILRDPSLGNKTRAFGKHIIENYSFFFPVFKPALKRAFWHSVIPELATTEAKSMDSAFQGAAEKYIRNPQATDPIQIEKLPELEERVHEVVKAHIRANLPLSPSSWCHLF